jgi:hypothetical protein
VDDRAENPLKSHGDDGIALGEGQLIRKPVYFRKLMRAATLVTYAGQSHSQPSEWISASTSQQITHRQYVHLRKDCTFLPLLVLFSSIVAMVDEVS